MVSVNQTASAPPCALSVGVISSFVPTRPSSMPIGRLNGRRNQTSTNGSIRSTTSGLTGSSGQNGHLPSRHSQHQRPFVPSQSSSSSRPSQSRSSHQQHRIKPHQSALPDVHSFGADTRCSLHPSCHREDIRFSFISPCVKYSLFFFNLLFWIIGATLMGLGCWSLLEEYDYNILKFRNIFDLVLHISLCLVLAGFVIFFMSLTGCLGALRENLFLIKLYSLMLLLLFIAEVVISSFAFIFPSSLSAFVKERLSKDLITLYREDSNLQNLIDIIQMNFQCCGVSDKGFKDWNFNIYFNCSLSNPSSERCAVPFSCCRDLSTDLLNIMCGYNIQNLSSVVEVNQYIFTRGCVEVFSELVERNMNLVAGVCLGSALAQLFAMFLARSLQGQIYSQKASWAL